MAKFLHIADVHLGISRYRRYGTADRTRDFFLAWSDTIEKYALGTGVDFVIIAGDFFDTRRVEPQAMNHAMYCLKKLQDAKIPVIVIEGNHDQRESTNNFSWLRSLSSWGFIILLEPFYGEDGTVTLKPWNPNTKSGSYYDVNANGATFRIFGTTWYGTTIARQLPVLLDQLRDHRRPEAMNILLLHTDVEGQLNRPIPALPVAKLNELKGTIDYLALGHTHKNFEIDGWIFNPGSLEACSVDEYANTRGAYLVEVNGTSFTASLVQDYQQRPFVRFRYDVSGNQTPEEVTAGLFEKLRAEVRPVKEGETAPVLEVTLAGNLGFKTSLLELNKLREEIRKEFLPFLCITRDLTVPVEYAVAADTSEMISRPERERRIFEDLISRDARFKEKASEISALVQEAKHLALGEEDPEKIVALLEQRI